MTAPSHITRVPRRPIVDLDDPDGDADRDQIQAICDAVGELQAEGAGEGETGGVTGIGGGDMDGVLGVRIGDGGGGDLAWRISSLSRRMAGLSGGSTQGTAFAGTAGGSYQQRHG